MDENAGSYHFPGGGYGVIAYKHEGHDVAVELNKLGIAAMVVKYRLPAESEIKPSKFVPLQDAQQAIAIVRRNATAWNLDLDKIGLMGFSAGDTLPPPQAHIMPTVKYLIQQPTSGRILWY